MSDTIVVMNNGIIQQIGTPTDIYNEPKNAFVADFIGESNIFTGTMLEDYLVEFFAKKFKCVDKGFATNEKVDVVIRPEDIKLIAAEQAKLEGTVLSVTFKGVHYEMLIESNGMEWMVHSTTMEPAGTRVGLDFGPNDIHIMKRVTAYEKELVSLPLYIMDTSFCSVPHGTGIRLWCCGQD